MASRHASSRAAPIPFPREFVSTPVGPKKFRQVASWQAKPSKLFAWIATKQDTGWRAKATSASLAQASLKLLRTQSTTLCFSGGKAQRIDIPAAARRLKVWLESGSPYNFTSISTAMNSDQSLRAAMAKRTPPVVRVDPAIIAREHRTTFRLSSPATGLAFGE